MIIKFLHPNPAMRKYEARRFCPVNMFEKESVAIMPYSSITVNSMTTGLVGRLRKDLLYPYQIFYDIGCGITVLVFDDLPDNYEQLISDIDLSGFEDESIQSLFPADMASFSNDVTVDEVQKLISRESQKTHEPYIEMMIQGVKVRLDQSSLVRQVKDDQSDHNCRLFKLQSTNCDNVLSLKWNVD